MRTPQHLLLHISTFLLLSSNTRFLVKRAESFSVQPRQRPPSCQHRPHATVVTTTQLEAVPSPLGGDSTNKYRIVSKRPGGVVRDPKTGFYRPVPRTTQDKSTIKDDGTPNAWDSFKSVIYGGMDGAKSIPDILSKITSDKNKEGASIIVDGYKEVQQRVYESGGDGKSSPGKRLLQEYEQQQRRIIVDDDGSSSSSLSPFGLNKKKRKNKAKSNNLFDTLKGAVYKTADLFANNNDKRNDDKGSNYYLETFKPVVKSSLASSAQVQDSLDDLLQSDNPVRKAIARYRIQEFDRKDKDLDHEIERYRKTRQVKEVVYGLGDAAYGSIQAMSELPDKVSSLWQKVQEISKSVSSSAQQLVGSVTAIPNKVQQTSQQLQQSVQQSLETTRHVVQQVQAVPVKLKTTAQSTQESVKAAVQVVDETVTRGKVLLGLEKAVPRPPTAPPPKPLTTKEIGWKVAEGVASGASKVAWWTTKGVARLTWTGATFAFEKGIQAWKEEQEKTKVENPAQKMAAASSSTTSTATKPVTKKSPSITTTTASKTKEKPIKIVRNEDLDRQVEEALQLAEEALKMAEGGKNKNQDSLTLPSAMEQEDSFS